MLLQGAVLGPHLAIYPNLSTPLNKFPPLFCHNMEIVFFNISAI